MDGGSDEYHPLFGEGYWEPGSDYDNYEGSLDHSQSEFEGNDDDWFAGYHNFDAQIQVASMVAAAEAALLAATGATTSSTTTGTQRGQWLLQPSTAWTPPLPTEDTVTDVLEACAHGDMVLCCADKVQLKAHSQLLRLHSPVLRSKLDKLNGQQVGQAAGPPQDLSAALSGKVGYHPPHSTLLNSWNASSGTLPQEGTASGSLCAAEPSNCALVSPPDSTVHCENGPFLPPSSTPGYAPPSETGAQPAPVNPGLQMLQVAEPSQEWVLLLAAIYLVDCDHVFTMDYAHTIARLATTYRMKRVLKLIGDCVIVAGQEWIIRFDPRTAVTNTRGGLPVARRLRQQGLIDGRRAEDNAVLERNAYLSPQYVNHPCHVLQLIQLVQCTGHAVAKECVTDLLKAHSGTLYQIFQTSSVEDLPNITMDVGLLLLCACASVMRSRIPGLSTARHKSHDLVMKYLTGCISHRDDYDDADGYPDKTSMAVVSPAEEQSVKKQHAGRHKSTQTDEPSLPEDKHQVSVAPAHLTELLSMLSDGDIILRCKRDGQDVRAHMCILRQQSALLRDMLGDVDVCNEPTHPGRDASGPFVLPVDDSSNQWMAALAVMYPLDDDGGCSIDLVHSVLELADKYDMRLVRKRVMAHWSSNRNLLAALKDSMTCDKMRDALRLLSLCSVDDLEGATRLCSFLLERERLAWFFAVMVDVEPHEMPVLSAQAWWVILKKLTEQARGW